MRLLPCSPPRTRAPITRLHPPCRARARTRNHKRRWTMDSLRRNHQDTKDTKDTKNSKVSAPERPFAPAQGPAANVARERLGPGRSLDHFLVSWWFRLFVPIVSI